MQYPYIERASYAALMFILLLLAGMYPIPGKEGGVVFFGALIFATPFLRWILQPILLLAVFLMVISATPAAWVVNAPQTSLIGEQLLLALGLGVGVLLAPIVYPVWDKEGTSQNIGPVLFWCAGPCAWAVSFAAFLAGAAPVFCLGLLGVALAAHFAHATVLDGWFKTAPSPESYDPPLG